MDESKLPFNRARTYLLLGAVLAIAYSTQNAFAGTARVSTMQPGATPFIESVTAN